MIAWPSTGSRYRAGPEPRVFWAIVSGKTGVGWADPWPRNRREADQGVQAGISSMGFGLRPLRLDIAMA